MHAGLFFVAGGRVRAWARSRRSRVIFSGFSDRKKCKIMKILFFCIFEYVVGSLFLDSFRCPGRPLELFKGLDPLYPFKDHVIQQIWASESFLKFQNSLFLLIFVD